MVFIVYNPIKIHIVLERVGKNRFFLLQESPTLTVSVTLIECLSTKNMVCSRALVY